MRSVIPIFLLSIVALSGIISNPARANDEAAPIVQQRVSPASNSIELDPGSEYDGEFTVSNVDSEALTFKIYAAPFSVVGEDYSHDYSAIKNYNQIYRWAKFEKATFNLSVGESQIIKYHINVPSDVAAGSQHAVLFSEASSNSALSNSHSLKTISRVGMRLIVKISGETRADAVEITEYGVPTLYLSFVSSKITATSKIKNTGNIDVEASYHFQIEPFFGGDPVFSFDKDNLIYPDSEYRHNITWDHTPLLGLFNVSYSVAAGEITRDSQFVVLVAPAWLLIILLLLFAFLAVWITIKVKKRLKLRAKMKL